MCCKELPWHTAWPRSLFLLRRAGGCPALALLFCLIYWGILYFFGGSDPYSLHGNATIPFDRAILGENHLYRGFGIPFDPEGILSSLPSVVTVIIGYLAGMMIKETERNRVPVKLVLYGIAFTIAGYLWGLLFPSTNRCGPVHTCFTRRGLPPCVFALLIYIIDREGI